LYAIMISRSCLSIKNLVVAIAFGVSLAGFRGFPVEAEASEPVGVDEKVRVELYYESQCPGCREMVTTSFYKAFQTEGFLDMAEVEFVPYGNAQETKTESGTYEFECQHGPSECVYNTVEACALAKIDDPLLAFQYIDCIERSDDSRDPQQDYYKVAIACCELTKIPDATVVQMEECATGLEGIQLEHEAAVKTEALDPPHTYVPYVVVNNSHSDDVQEAITDSLFNYVCGAYLGVNKSAACPGETETETRTVTNSLLRASAGVSGYFPLEATSLLRASAGVGRHFPLEEKNVCYRGDEPTNTAAITSNSSTSTSSRVDAAKVAEE
jgi:interferon gamma-inducible protein 30